MISFPTIQAEIQFVKSIGHSDLFVLREDRIHPEISGNKYRKLKYNLEAFSQGNYESILSFGGAYSNHIAALAAAGREFKIPTIGIIRGEELKDKIQGNPTLSYAKQNGMRLEFVSRTTYREKNQPKFLEELRMKFGNVYILPEGGTNEMAIKGCEEILGKHTAEFDYICCAVGTGGTIRGILNSALPHQKVLGFPALKDSEFLKNEINQVGKRSNFDWINNFHFGGYGKYSTELIDFINEFKNQYNVPLEPIYTGKMFYGIVQLMKEKFFPVDSKILAVHTGGLQGIEGINQRLKEKNKPLLG